MGRTRSKAWKVGFDISISEAFRSSRMAYVAFFSGMAKARAGVGILRLGFLAMRMIPLCLLEELIIQIHTNIHGSVPLISLSCSSGLW